MRKLLWITVGFALGCGLCVTLLWQQNLLPLMIYAFLSGAVCFFLKSRNDLFRVPAAIFLGLTGSLIWFALFFGFYLQTLQPLDGQTLPLSVTVTQYSRKNTYGLSTEGYAVLEGKPYRMVIYQRDDTMLQPGDVLQSDFRLRLTTPEGKKDSSFYQGKGVFLVANQKGDTNCSISE